VRIGLVTAYMLPHPGGIERVAETLFSAYQHLGHETRWVASRVPADAALRDGGRIRVPCWNGIEQLLGVPVPIWGPRSWRELRALVDWADVLNVHDCLYVSSALAVAAARRAGKPVLLSQHIGFTRYPSSLLNGVERLAYATLGRAVLRAATRIVFATPKAEAWVPRLLGTEPANACAIPNGIDTERFRQATPPERRQARLRLGLLPNGPVALFVGRLVPNKGVGILLETARRLPEVGFLAVGSGPLAHLMAARPDNLRWQPAVPADEMPGCYQACDCLLLPSVDEGLPLVVQEAMACGLPAVVSTAELFAEPLAQLGLCFPAPRHADGVALRVREVLAGWNPTLAARARAHAETHWSVAAMSGGYLALLQQMAKDRRANAGSVREHADL
jgi:glycosyltransferase involved in cell wall biosynthesis